MRARLLCVIFAATAVIVGCSRQKTEDHGAAGGSSAASSNNPQAAASQLSAAAASRAAALEDATWRAHWRQQYLAGRDLQKDRAAIERAAQQELSVPDADPSDIAAKAKSLGPDPQKTFEFLRDQVAVEPYAGVLRGARGTLMAGAGNALDRALLAQELLKIQGQTTRLVRGQLSEDQTQVLLSRFLATGPVPRQLADQTTRVGDSELPQVSSDAAEKSGLPQAAVADLLSHARDRDRIFQSQLDASTSRQFELLRQQLTQDRKRVPVEVAALHSTLKERLRTHYWVQLRTRDGQWTDFDPTLPGAASGTRYGTDPSVVTEIPASEFHELQFSLIYLAVRDGAQTEDVLVSGSVRSSDALFEPVNFTIQPTGGSDAIDVLVTQDSKQKIQSLKELRRFQGVLQIGSAVTASRAFDMDGNIFDKADAPLPMSQATSIADALGGGGQTPPQFVELRVALQLNGPGREPEKQIRTLVRGKDVQAPTFAPPLMAWELLIQPQWVSPKWVGINALRQLTAAWKTSQQLAPGAPQSASSTQPQTASMRLLQMALLRQVTLGDVLKARDGLTAMIDEPQLTIYGFRLAGIQQQPADIRGEHFIDLVENAVRIVPNDQRSVASAYEVALHQSSADSSMESGFLGVLNPGSEPSSGSVTFETARSKGRPLYLASSRDVDKLRDSGVSEGDIEWIYDNESPSTRLLVATTPDGSTAWWSVRQDGNAILRMNGGRGVSETTILITKVAVASICFIEAAFVGRCLGEREGRMASFVCMVSAFTAAGFVVIGVPHWASFILLDAEIAHGLFDGAKMGSSGESHCM